MLQGLEIHISKEIIFLCNHYNKAVIVIYDSNK